MLNQIKYLLVLAIILLVPLVAAAQENEDDEDFISPVRPTISDSAKIQKAGVLQIEAGGDFGFDAADFRDQQAAPLGVYFAVSKRLRLDFEIDSIVSQKNQTRETGIGDINLGFKAIARDKPEEKLAVAFAYSIKLPVASSERELGSGKVDHNLRLILNRTFGKNDFIVNFSYLNNGLETSDKRDSGGQVVFGYERELPKNFSAHLELYGNTIEAEQPRGLYILSVLTYKVNKRLILDAGVQPGFGQDAPNFDFFFGLSVGVANLYRKK